MAAYLVAQVEVTDPELFEQYRRQVPAVIEQYGGRYLTRGGKVEVVEGEWDVPRLVILEFPTMEQLLRFYNSPEYAPLLGLRHKAATSVVALVEGTPDS
jgi:uncharacterized protein (DUF1330 family)